MNNNLIKRTSSKVNKKDQSHMDRCDGISTPCTIGCLKQRQARATTSHFVLRVGSSGLVWNMLAARQIRENRVKRSGNRSGRRLEKFDLDFKLQYHSNFLQRNPALSCSRSALAP
jgi:hypothetical protein